MKGRSVRKRKEFLHMDMGDVNSQEKFHAGSSAEQDGNMWRSGISCMCSNVYLATPATDNYKRRRGTRLDQVGCYATIPHLVTPGSPTTTWP